MVSDLLTSLLTKDSNIKLPIVIKYTFHEFILFLSNIYLICPSEITFNYCTGKIMNVIPRCDPLQLSENLEKYITIGCLSFNISKAIFNNFKRG